MKVFLADQIVSTSVSAGLKTCEYDYGLPEFEDAAATTKFC